jgi:hypothetical protein
VIIRYAARTDGLPTDRDAARALDSFERERRAPVAFQALATGLALVWPVVAVLVFLTISLLILVDPLWRIRQQRRERR